MAKEKPEAKLSKEERRALKAEKKAEKKSKAAPVDGGLVADAGVTKVKSDKKEKKAKREALKEKVLNEIEKSEVAEVKDRDARKKDLADDDVDRDMEVRSDDGRVDEEENTKKEAVRPIGALVPFANPLADEKVAKKVFKCVKKAAAQRTLKRGVKEVVKALRKSAATNPPSSTSDSSAPLGIVVLAADISPMDVISHIPVLCEDHNIPYIYVTSRAELGAAGQTKRPTSVVMVVRDVGKKKEGASKTEGGEEGDDWTETYKSLVKVVEREGRHVKV